jgi:hypothetical protein
MTPITFQGHFEQQDTRAAGSPQGVQMPRVLVKNPGIYSGEARVQAKSLPHQTAGRNDRRDIDRRELKLLRIGHYLWAIYKKECGKSGNVSQQQALETALRQVWDLKKKIRQELKAERAARAELLRERFGKAKSSSSTKMVDLGLPVQGARVEGLEICQTEPLRRAGTNKQQTADAHSMSGCNREHMVRAGAAITPELLEKGLPSSWGKECPPFYNDCLGNKGDGCLRESIQSG